MFVSKQKPVTSKNNQRDEQRTITLRAGGIINGPDKGKGVVPDIFFMVEVSSRFVPSGHPPTNTANNNGGAALCR